MRARLTLETGDASPREWQLEAGQTIQLGRNHENHILLRDQHASRRHAEIYCTDSVWMLRDLGTVNGTRLNGNRITAPVPLENGCVIRVGDVRLRFLLEGSESPTDEIEPLQDLAEEGVADSKQEPITDFHDDPTALETDELTALLAFIDGSLRETTASGVVSLALRTAHRQTRAAVSGFLSLDDSDDLPRMVLPEQTQVDIPLSRQLTLQVQRDGRTAWMARARDHGATTSESMVAYHDAFCVPVRGEEGPLGALHVYRTGSNFSVRDVCFCEAMAAYLFRRLLALRAQRALEADNSRLRVRSASANSDMIGQGPLMENLREQIRKLSRGPKVVLVCGESGAGKELVALELHRRSDRGKGPLVAVNCAAIPATMYEAELFGHVRGAFTGAVLDRPGYFQQAEMGTLFLDEIGELSLDCQAKLLRVLENYTYRPVGAQAEMKADVRIIAATNRDLKQECLEGRFRKDLYFRLGLEITVPPLRDRREDIPVLAEHFLKRLSVEYRRMAQLSPKALERLKEQPWPGNVRQLRSVLEHAVAMGEGGVIEPGDLHLVSDGPVALPEGLSLNLEELEAWAVRQALERTGGTIVQAARLLHIHRDTLVAKIGKYGIEKR